MFFVKIRILSLISTFIMTKGLVVYVKSTENKYFVCIFRKVRKRSISTCNLQITCPAELSVSCGQRLGK